MGRKTHHQPPLCPRAPHWSPGLPVIEEAGLQPIWEECNMVTEVVPARVASRPNFQASSKSTVLNTDGRYDLEEWTSTYADVSKGQGISFRQLRSFNRQPFVLITRRTLSLCLASGLAFFLMLKMFTPLQCGSFPCPHGTVQQAASYHLEAGDLYLPRRLRVMMQSQYQQQGGWKGQLLAAQQVPMLIPRVIHQATLGNVHGGMAKIRGSWKLINSGGWEYRLYDKAACLALVRGELPHYLHAYQTLTSDADRANFFRFLVILKYGGVHADLNVECRKPLDGVLKPLDTLVSGWEPNEAGQTEVVPIGSPHRQHLLPWFFAAAPYHPALVEICDGIAAAATAVGTANVPGQEAQGAAQALRAATGKWADLVLRHATQVLPATQVGSRSWSVRILPQAAFSIQTVGQSQPPASHAETIFIRHPAREIPQGCHIWECVRNWLHDERPDANGPSVQPSEENAFSPAATALLPVSVSFEPSFTMMVDAAAQGDTQWGKDVSAGITQWGTWQAALWPPTRRPSAAEALVGSLGSRSTRSTLVDVGAAQGLFSLAAAARGHRAIAFEASGPSIASLQASVQLNALDGLVELHAMQLGARNELICLQRRGVLGEADAADVEMRRGYGDPLVHALGADPELCNVTGQRRTLPEALGILGSGEVGALRLSANGWEGWIIVGAAQWLQRSPPGIVLLEFAPSLVRKAGYEPVKIFQLLNRLGYTHAAHAGRVCDERWRNLTWAHDHGAASSLPDVKEANAKLGGQLGDGLGETHDSTWCHLKPDTYEMLVDHAHGDSPEDVLFIHAGHRSVAAL